MSARRILAVVGLALTTIAAPLHAHLMPAQSGTLNVRDRAVFGALSIPVSALAGFDDDGNSRLSTIELQRHHAALQQQISSRLQLHNDTDLGTRDFLQLSVELAENDPAAAGGGTHVLVLVKQSFASTPQHLRINTDLFGERPAEQLLAIKAIIDGNAEMAVLRASSPGHTFFEPPTRIAAQYTALGVEHILTGVDHVLFVLTIIIAAAGWRYWLAVLTSFTVAHSITLALGMLNVVHIPSRIVEPLILASIALMFWLNTTHKATSLPARAAIVFACGLLHGLGFASSIATVGLHGTNKLISLLSFNVGIELGQSMVVAIALLTIAAKKSLIPTPPKSQAPLIPSALNSQRP